MVENTPYTRPAQNAPYTNPVDPARGNDHGRDASRNTTVVKSGGSYGMIAGVVLVVLLAIAGYFFLTGGEPDVTGAPAPASESTMDAAPAADPANPAVPAPDMPAELAPMDAAPADPAPVDPATPAPAAPASGG